VRRALWMAILFLGPAVTPRGAAQQTANPAASAPAAAPAQSPAGRSLTIEEAEAIALKNNPQITLGKLRALEAHEFVREVRATLLPQANGFLEGVGADSGTRLSAGGFLTNGAMFSRAAAGVAVSQLITDFGRTPNLLSSSKYQAKAEDENAVATRQQIVLAVDQAFYNVLETKALLKVAQDTVKARQNLVDQIQALTDAKLRSEIDLSFSKVDLARAKLLMLDSESGYQASLSTLSAILGYPEQQDFTVVESAPQTVSPPAADPLPLIRQAMQLRPEILALQNEVTAAEKFGRAEHDLWWPTVSGLGTVGAAPVRDSNITSRYGAAGVTMYVPLFNGFLYNARAKSADLETEVKRKRLQDTQDNVARDVRNGWLDTNKAFERLSVTKQLREQAQLSLELADARYKLGLGTIVEFSQAELQQTDAELQDTDAHYQYILSHLVLAYEMGLTR
jgi:outer membrane protein